MSFASKRFGYYLILITAGAFLQSPSESTAADDTTTPTARWSAETARKWYDGKPWLVGCNFSPSTAINQLEMWQADTFDPTTIDRELGWAASIGFNSIRVYLHDIPWKQDKAGFLKRTDKFLEIADKHGIGVMFVVFDSVWDPNPKAGKQREPEKGLHNPGWVQSPAREILGDPKRCDELEDYVKGFIGHYRNDKRVHVWDLYNEPDNTNDNSYKEQELPNKSEFVLQLLGKTFRWAAEVNPSQPLTSAVWRNSWEDPEKLTPMEKLQLGSSDIITFHDYGKLEGVKQAVDSLRRYQRPIICTEYMARPQGSTFDPVMGYFKEQKIGAYNWGFVSGKTQTIYPWDSWKNRYDAEPPLWFHDIFRPDGTPYIPNEVDYIRSLTGKEASKPKP